MIRLPLVWPPRQTSVPKTRCEQQNREPRGFGRWIILLCVGLTLSSAAICANANTPIYPYDSGGTSVNVTSAYIYQEHYLYDSAYNLVGTVDANGLIYDLNDQEIGYIANGLVYDLDDQELGYIVPNSAL